MGIRMGVDTGGTFTDLVAINEENHMLYTRKESSTPSNPVAALKAVLKNSQVNLKRVTRTVLGTTVATNAILQRDGAQVLFLTTQGIEDLLFIQRINRPNNYDLRWRKPAPLVKRHHCLGVNERVNYKGQVVQPLTEEELRKVGDRVEAIIIRDGIKALAICLLFAYINPEHERKLSTYLNKRFADLPQSVSHKLVPIWREYERSSTTVADAFVKPLIKRYVTDARRAHQDAAVSGVQCLMKSNGGMTLLNAAVDRPIDTLLSGLVAGVVAGNFFGQLAGYKNLITLDLGGTSCDVGMVVDGQPRYTTGFEIEWGLPVSVPVIDVTTIGAGGGSIAWVDRGGFLRVGPQSAGADPGPAAYGAGGDQPTVTDANLMLGRLNPAYFLGGRLPLYKRKSEMAIAGLAQKLEMSIQKSAAAITNVVNDNMASAIRLLTVEKGIDPRNFTLVVFGGAGPVHASSLARLLQISRIVIPIYPGLVSAFGALITDVRIDKVWTQAYRSDNLDLSRVRAKFRAMVKEAQDELQQQGYSGEMRLFLSISMRYLEQNYEEDIYISSPELDEVELHQAFRRFHDRHHQFYGYAFPNEIIELLHFKVSAVGPVQTQELPRLTVKNDKPIPTFRPVILDKGLHERCPVFYRHQLPPGFELSNPAIIEDIDSTILIEVGDKLFVDAFGNIMIESGESL